MAFLDGFRGMAALQVVLLHYCAAFLPGLGTQNSSLIRYGWEAAWLRPPLFFIVDGTFAVYVFFAISGFVLTFAYGHLRFHPVRAIAQRIVRLGLPMAAALAFGALLIALLPRAHDEAAALSGSADWLGALYRVTPTIGEVLHQAMGSGMVSGYSDGLLAPQIFDAAISRDPITRSFDPPLWTLHYEFWGSVLIILLSTLQRRVPRAARIGAAAALALILLRHPLLPFVVGHLFALVWTSGRWPALPSLRWRILGVSALAGAILSCTSPPWPWITWLFTVSEHLSALNDAHLQAMYGALSAFAGVMLLPGLHRALTRRGIAWLGRVSFGLYLIHFPILFTISSAAFVLLRTPLHYGGAALAAFATGVPLSLLSAEIFTRLVDQPAVQLSRLLSKRRVARAAAERSSRPTPL